MLVRKLFVASALAAGVIATVESPSLHTSIPTPIPCAPNAGAPMCADYEDECGGFWTFCGIRGCNGKLPPPDIPPCTKTVTVEPIPITKIRPTVPKPTSTATTASLTFVKATLTKITTIRTYSTRTRRTTWKPITTTATHETYTKSSTAVPTLSTISIGTCDPMSGVGICVDYINNCGQMYGLCTTIGCDGAFPTATAPPCSCTTPCWGEPIAIATPTP